MWMQDCALQVRLTRCVWSLEFRWQDLAASRLLQILSFTLWPPCAGWITAGLQQIAVVSALPRWWSWKCRGWSLWLPIGSSTAPWRWKEARSSRQTKQRRPSPRKCLSARAGVHVCVWSSSKNVPVSQAEECRARVWRQLSSWTLQETTCLVGRQRRDIFQLQSFLNI